MISTPPAVQTPVSLSLPRSLKSIQEIRRTAHNPPPYYYYYQPNYWCYSYYNY